MKQTQQDALAVVQNASATEPRTAESAQAEQVVTKMAMSATGAALSTTATAALAASTASGATAATVGAAAASAVPVVGWIVAGGLLLAAGTIVLVGKVRRGKMRRQEAVAAAQAMGMPDAAEVPGFIVGALKNGQAWRLKQMGKLSKRAARGNPRGKDATKLRLLAAVELTERAAANGYEPPAAPVAALAQEYPVPPGMTWWPVVAAGGIAVVIFGLAAAARATGRV